MKDPKRRSVVKTLVVWSLGLPAAMRLEAQSSSDPRKARPQEGDRFVYALGDREGEVVELDDLEPGAPQVICYAMEPVSGVVRDGSRLNQVLLVRLAPEELSEETLALSASGVVAYSAICPHTGCDVTLWRDEGRNLLCSCHDSEFDPRHRAEVMSGPAPRRLPALPLRIEEGRLEAAGEFDARIRFQRNF